MTKALYCGSFDPFTLGHLSVVEQALEHLNTPYKQIEKIYICIGSNDAKTPLFRKEDRIKMIKEAFINHPHKDNIEVISYQGLTVDLAYRLGAKYLIRGIRKNDLNNQNEEKKLAIINQELSKTLGFNLETLFFESRTMLLSTISSSIVKSLCSCGEYIAVANFVPFNVHQELMKHYLKHRFLKLFYPECRSIAESYWNEVVSAYQTRPYHNLSHIAFMFNLLDKYSSANNYKSTDMELAIFAHDIVYDVRSSDNELNSALQALSWYGAKYSKSDDLLKNLILATKQDAKPTTTDEALLKDLDLSILGTHSPKITQNYTKGIRQEYSYLNDEEYIKGRTAFLTGLMNEKRIFQTDFFYNCFESLARENISKELFGLRYKKI
ncbi:MAG: pantetheine-phosphate adenylyltransferase [Alphaproteobacteria bacterium]|nr:pantetheine-phosphate adenylyltransferase [Alphaproteobacteria bacterium]